MKSTRQAVRVGPNHLIMEQASLLLECYYLRDQILQPSLRPSLRSSLDPEHRDSDKDFKRSILTIINSSENWNNILMQVTSVVMNKFQSRVITLLYNKAQGLNIQSCDRLVLTNQSPLL